jgi:tetratricopeptide (TPR) repeat protein
MQALEKAILLKPDFNDAMVFLGNIAFDLKWWQKSSNSYTEALKLNNLEGLQGLRNIAYELEAKGDKTSGLEYLLKAQSIKPKDKALAEEILSWQES